MLHRHLSITIIQCKLRICDSKVFVLCFRKINIFVLKWSKKKKMSEDSRLRVGLCLAIHQLNNLSQVGMIYYCDTVPYASLSWFQKKNLSVRSAKNEPQITSQRI